MHKATRLSLTLCAVATLWTVAVFPAETPTKGTISGRVLTGNGEPLRRATVALEQVKYADGSADTVGDTTTGDNGEFSFSDLAPARYRLQAEKSGYVAGRFPSTNALVRITPGDTVSDITLRLVAVGVVSGSVLDENGDPLSKAVVRLLQYRYYPGGRRLAVAREAISDERGEYRIGDLDPGRYDAVASYRSRISNVVCPPVYYPDVATFDDALPIRLSPSDEAPIKFVLLPGRPFRVRGSVAGAATGSVRVSLIPRGGVPYAELLSVETSDGTFQFKNVLPGDYTLLATSQNTDEMLEGRTTITVQDHDLTAVSVVLKARMDHRRLWVHVKGAVSIQDVVISLHRAFTSEEDSVIVAEDDLAEQAREISTRGGNAIDLPYPGPFLVSVEKLPADFYIEHVDFKNETSGPQTTESLDVYLSSDGASVEGVVLDSADHPVPGAVVVAIPDHQQNNVDQSRITTTDQYGQFALRGLVPTGCEIYAWEEVPDGAFHDPDFLADYADSAQGISLHSGHRNQVILHVQHAASSQD